MTNEEINKYIHTEIMGLCWHEGVTDADFQHKDGDIISIDHWCPKCEYAVDEIDDDWSDASGYNPDYCSDDSPRRLLNAVLAKLETTFGTGNVSAIMVKSDAFNGYVANGASLGVWMGAPAETIAKFCVEAHKDHKGD